MNYKEGKTLFASNAFRSAYFIIGVSPSIAGLIANSYIQGGDAYRYQNLFIWWRSINHDV
jgi:hypothetical protein